MIFLIKKDSLIQKDYIFLTNKPRNSNRIQDVLCLSFNKRFSFLKKRRNFVEVIFHGTMNLSQLMLTRSWLNSPAYAPALFLRRELRLKVTNHKFYCTHDKGGRSCFRTNNLSYIHFYDEKSCKRKKKEGMRTLEI